VEYHKARYWPHYCFICISDIPDTVSSKFCYADDIAISFSDKSFENIEHTKTDNVIALNNFFKKWRLVPSPNKTEVSCFNLTNKLAKRELQVLFANQRLKHNHFPKYLGVTLDRVRCFKKHLTNIAGKLRSQNIIIQKLYRTT